MQPMSRWWIVFRGIAVMLVLPAALTAGVKTTVFAAPPSVATSAASAVSTTSATLNGIVNANGSSATVIFEYGPAISYGNVVTANQSPVTGATDTAVSTSATGLTPNTTYHYRVVAVNADGTTNGEDRTLTTLALEPEMAVNGNGQIIYDGDSEPSDADHTDFGSADIVTGMVVRTFTIINTGVGDLHLTGAPKVSVSGTNALEFEVIPSPSSPIPPGGTTSFGVSFDPSATGVRTAVLTIANNDSNENPYNFTIQGHGTTVQLWTLNLLMSGTGSGVVVSSPTGTTCSADCSEKFEHGTEVTLTATPDPGYVFSGWSGGGCSGTGTCQLTMDADNTVTATLADPFTDTDIDGIADVEEQGPSLDDISYDGNADGLADWQQVNVVSFRNHDGQHYITLAAPDPTAISGVQALKQPVSSDPLAGMVFPYGFFSFTLSNLPPSGSVAVTLNLPEGPATLTYYKFGKTPDDPTDHWYEFLYNGKTGAEIDGNVISLHFMDGIRGDDDLAENGFVVDVGGPAISPNDDSDDGGSGGCFIQAAEKK